MRRRRPLAAALAVVLAVGVAGCSDGDDTDVAAESTTTSTTEPIDFAFDGVAATVDGTDIDAALLGEQVDVVLEHPAAGELLLQVTELTQADSDEPDPVVVAGLLTRLVLSELVAAEVAERGLEVDDATRSIVRTQAEAFFGDTTAELPAEFVDRLIEQNAEVATLDEDLRGPDPTETAIVAQFEANRELYSEACVRHILVDTEDEANDLLGELEDGADFAELAVESSTDGSAAEGGDLGCMGPGVYVEPFENAVWGGPVGETQGPVETQFGFHLVLVESRRQLEFLEARDDVVADLTLAPYEAIDGWLPEAVAGADITVSEDFGTWSPDDLAVIPRGVPTETLDLVPSDTTDTDTGPDDSDTDEPDGTTSTAGDGG
ncbi:MAG: peptidylprolyl isomerase [Actinomycetota bacterium]|nr:peptidylprolyl isomerase [Actinomycetota bacterium]